MNTKALSSLPIGLIALLLLAAVAMMLLPKEAPSIDWDGSQLQKEEVEIVVLSSSSQVSENEAVEITTTTLDNGNCKMTINFKGIDNPFEIVKRKCESPEMKNEAYHKATEFFLQFIEENKELLILLEAGLRQLLLP